jgi:hypothetical protein
MCIEKRSLSQIAERSVTLSPLLSVRQAIDSGDSRSQSSIENNQPGLIAVFRTQKCSRRRHPFESFLGQSLDGDASQLKIAKYYSFKRLFDNGTNYIDIN